MLASYRLATFSVLRGKLRGGCGGLTALRRLSQPAPAATPLVGDPKLLEIAPSWPPEEQPDLREGVARGMAVLPDFLTEDEERDMLAELEPRLKRMRYEYDHWDNAIHGYRETERAEWRGAGAAVLSRVRAAVFCGGDRAAGEPLPAAHVLDLAAGGCIKPHIDAVRFCGEAIAGLCLSSAAVMRLKHPQHPHLVMDALLPRRCLYVMRGVARYEFTHEVLGNEQSSFRGSPVRKARRVAVILRSKPRPEDAPSANEVH